MTGKSKAGFPGARSPNTERVIGLLARIAPPEDWPLDVRCRLQREGETRRRKDVALSRFALASHELRRNEQISVSAAKVLVAALPGSLDAIARLLKVRTGKYA